MSEKTHAQALLQVAEEWSTPSFVYDIDRVRAQARALREHLHHPGSSCSTPSRPTPVRPWCARC